MKQHRYRLTLEHTAAIKPDDSLHAPLQFDAANHDDLFLIIERIKKAALFEGDEAVAFAVGLKLFGETMLMHREHPLFADMREPFLAFMKTLKSSVKNASPDH